MLLSMYRRHAIITRGLYIFYPLFEIQKRFSRNFLLKILTLFIVSIQERVIMARLRYFNRAISKVLVIRESYLFFLSSSFCPFICLSLFSFVFRIYATHHMPSRKTNYEFFTEFRKGFKILVCLLQSDRLEFV